MYVLMDIEWITNDNNDLNLTQVAAMRVDEKWNEIDTYFARIRPRDTSFHQWKHMGYSGGEKNDFLTADKLQEVLCNLDNWLCDDDVLCWWTHDSIKVLNMMFLMALKRRNNRKHILIRDKLFQFLEAQGITTGNPYKIAEAYGIPKFKPKHQSLSDVQTMRSVLSCVGFPMDRLTVSQEKPNRPKQMEESLAREEWPYQYDETTGYVHRKGCSAIPLTANLKGYMKLHAFLKKRAMPCPVCAAEEYRQIRKEWNQDVIDRSQYQFVYSDKSQVFHRRDCRVVLSTTGTIMGSVYYDGCICAGRRPCKICNPEPGTWLSAKAWKKAKKKSKVPCPDAVVPERSMTFGEQRAYKRYVEARGERFAANQAEFKTQREKDYFFTLTQPRYAFFCGAGYQTFHQRNCRKLQGLTNITGFARYRDAIRSGHTPCKYCKPTSKQNIVCAIPITNQKRKGESINDLQSLCAAQGYAHEIQNQYFCFATPVGKWKIDVSAHPYTVYHINRVMGPYNEHDYHKQPRLFLSLMDTFEYIQRHDKQLMIRGGLTTGVRLIAETG